VWRGRPSRAATQGEPAGRLGGAETPAQHVRRHLHLRQHVAQRQRVPVVPHGWTGRVVVGVHAGSSPDDVVPPQLRDAHERGCGAKHKHPTAKLRQRRHLQGKARRRRQGRRRLRAFSSPKSVTRSALRGVLDTEPAHPDVTIPCEYADIEADDSDEKQRPGEPDQDARVGERAPHLGCDPLKAAESPPIWARRH
jgi:hypothetical protein